MSNERVEELISIKALENFDVLNTKISESVTNIERLIATGVDLNKAFGASNGFKPTNEGAAKLATVEGQLKKMTEDLAKANAKLEASYSAQARSLGETKVQQQLVNKAHTDAAKEALGLVGAYDRLNKQYLDAAKNAKNMAAELGNDNEAVKEAAKYANDLQTRLKAIDANVGQFNRNVGNYAGSLGPALALLQKELQGIQAQMAGMKNTDPGFEKLAKQEQLLTSLNANLNKGFSSTRQELRAYTEASKQLGVELGLTNGLFVEFTEKVGDTKNELDDVQKVLNYKASDTKYLDGAIAAVNGLAGVYGAAQGAAELFGDQTGELQKQFVKLQAIMTIIQSLQAVENALQTESGALQLGLAAKTLLVNAALAVENALFATNAAVLATAAAAQEENAVAAEVGAAAMTEEAAATAAATTATISFRTALISTGIGALIVAIGAAIVYVASKIPDWIRGTQLTIEEQKTLAETLQKTNQALIDQADAQQYLDAESVRFNEQALAISQARGEDQYKQLALQRQIAVEEKVLAQQRIDLLNQDGKTLQTNLADYQKFSARKSKLLEDLAELQKVTASELTKDQKRELENWPKLIDVYDQQAAAAKSLYDAQVKARQDKDAAQLKLDVAEVAAAKLAADELRKLRLTEVQVEVDAVKNKNSIILSSDASTLQQRLKALASTAAAEKRALAASRDDVENNPTSTATEKLIAEKEFAGKMQTVTENLAKAQFDLRTQYAQRDRKARLEELKIKLEDQAKANDLIVDDEKKSFDKRLTALYAAMKQRQAVILSDRDEQLKDVRLTAEERNAITAKAASDYMDTVVQYGIKELALYKNNQALITASIEKEAEKRAAIVSAQGSGNVSGLNQQLLAGQISFTKYAKQRAEIEAQNNIDAAQDAVKTEQAKTAATKEGTAERAKAEADLAAKTVVLQDAVVAKTKLGQQELIASLETIKGYADTVFDLIGGALDASITAQKNALKDQSDAIDENTAKQIEAINNSGDTEERKAARIAVVNARAQAQKEVIAKKERQLDIQKAQFDKAKAIADIILNTAIAVVKALGEGGPIYAAIVGAIGAAQLAIAIATPLPRFATGTDDAPGGAAVVGDGGRSEMVVTPDGRLIYTPNTPTVMNVPRHSVIFPDADKFMEASVADGGRVPTLAESRAAFRDMTGELGGKMDKLIKVVSEKETIQILPRRDGWEKIKNRGNNKTRYLNDL